MPSCGIRVALEAVGAEADVVHMELVHRDWLVATRGTRDKVVYVIPNLYQQQQVDMGQRSESSIRRGDVVDE